MTDTAAAAQQTFDVPALTAAYGEWRALVAAAHAAADADRAPLGVLADWCEERGLPEAAAVRLAAEMRWGQDTEALAAALGLPAAAFAGWRYVPEDPMPHWVGSRLDGAGALLDWARRNLARLEAAAAAHVRRLRWLDAAAAGDPAALLAHPQGREAVRVLASGGKAGAVKPSSLAPRKCVASAKAKMAARLARRAAREEGAAARDGSPGRFAAKLLAKRKKLAVALGERYHREVKALYRSAYARVVYGPGGREERDDSRYSKGWHRSFGAASCRLAGARLDSESRPTCVVLENHLGREVARLPLPR